MWRNTLVLLARHPSPKPLPGNSVGPAGNSTTRIILLYYRCMRRAFYIKRLFVRWVAGPIALFFVFVPVPGLTTTMTSTNYKIVADSVSSGGVSSTSSNYIVSDNIGEFFATTTQSTNYVLEGGFLQQTQGVLTVTLSPTTISLGALSMNAVNSASQTLTVTLDVNSGYTAQITEDGDLRNGSEAINDVTDGEVNAGVEEYGISTSGTDGQYNAADTSITGSLKTIATRSSGASAVATTITYQASAGGATDTGSYSHTVTLYVTSNL